MTSGITIQRYEKNQIREMEDVVVREYPLTIFLNNNEFITMLCSPEYLEYLVYGFLKSEGIIFKKSDVKALTIDKDKGFAYVELSDSNSLAEALHGKRVMTTGCGKGSTFYKVLDLATMKPVQSELKVHAENILKMAGELNKQSKLFLETGGVHSCCLCDENQILVVREDIGRHNALDKILGEAFVNNTELHHKMMLTSGRISSEMLLKCSKSGIPIIVSRSAPTELAIREASKLNITVIGFARGGRMNIYSHPERVFW